MRDIVEAALAVEGGVHGGVADVLGLEFLPGSVVF
jgi:hypothetical protein